MDRARRWWLRITSAVRAGRDRLRDFLRRAATWLTDRVRKAAPRFRSGVTEQAQALRDVLFALSVGAMKALWVWMRRLWVFLGVRGFVLLALVGVAGLVSKLGLMGNDPTAQFLLNLGTDIFGAVVVFILLDVFVGTHERRKAEKADLILKMRSDEREVAVPAVDALRARGWLSDGSLRGAFLCFANLQGAVLPEANLQGADLAVSNLQEAILRGSKLQEANLSGANLQRVYLSGANLQEADLKEADLQEADLSGVNLQGAIMLGADLQGANLSGANLQGVDLERAILREGDRLEAELVVGYDEATTLPDGTKWTPDTDMARFTDPEHPDFWRSDDPNSPAYRGNARE